MYSVIFFELHQQAGYLVFKMFLGIFDFRYRFNYRFHGSFGNWLDRIISGIETAHCVFRILGLRRIASSLGIRDCNSSTVNSPNGLPAIRKSMQNSLTGVNEESVVSIPRRCMRFNTAERAFRSRSLWSAILSPLILPDCKHSHISSYSVGIISRSDEVRPSVNCNTKVSLYRSRSIPFALAMA